MNDFLACRTKKPTGIIAEIAGNFQTLEEGLYLARQASLLGATSIKLQTFQPHTLTSKHALFEMPNTGTRSQYDVFEETKLDYDIQRQLFKHLLNENINIFSTPSHPSDVDFLRSCGINSVLKIGSDDCSNLELIRACGEDNTHVIISTGMATLEEVEITANFCHKNNIDFSLMYCVTNYPCSLEQLNLSTITTYRNMFPGIEIGYSDHFPGNQAACIAKALGASFFEKHVMRDKNVDGYDTIVSLTLEELTDYKQAIESTGLMLGSAAKTLSTQEKINRKNNRKSLFFSNDVRKGDLIDSSNLIALRPGDGISPHLIYQFVGKRLLCDGSAGDYLTWDHVS